MSDRPVLVIIPTFNESENIIRLIDALLAYPQVDVLVVDDGSPDGTGQIVADHQAVHSDRLHLIQRTGKGGRGSAVLCGFQFALERRYVTIFEMDADFSHNPEELPAFLDAIRHADIVVGSRYIPGGEIHHWGWQRKLLSKFANMFVRFFLGMPLTDYTNGYRCYSREAVASLDMDTVRAAGYVVLSEVAYQLHRNEMRFAEVPSVFINRQRGESKLSLVEVREAFLSILRIRFRTLKSKR